MTPSAMPRMTTGVIAGAICPRAPCSDAGATVRRNDVVIMKNGDRLTGNVERLEDGVSYVETVYSRSVAGDWARMDRLTTTAQFQVVLVNGRRLVGNIQRRAVEGSSDFLICRSPENVHIHAQQVVNLESQKRTFWRRLKGSVDAGCSFTCGNSQTSTNADANIAYLSAGWQAGVSFTSAFGGQSGAKTINTLDGQLTGRPPATAQNNDLGVSSSIGSSFCPTVIVGAHRNR